MVATAGVLVIWCGRLCFSLQHLERHVEVVVFDINRHVFIHCRGAWYHTRSCIAAARAGVRQRRVDTAGLVIVCGSGEHLLFIRQQLVGHVEDVILDISRHVLIR